MRLRRSRLLVSVPANLPAPEEEKRAHDARNAASEFETMPTARGPGTPIANRRSGCQAGPYNQAMIKGDRLYFYSGSADRPPGQGVHEAVGELSAYAALGRIRHWRRMLSNFWTADFILNGCTYRTVEHAFQAAKIALVDPALARTFTLESGSQLAQGDGAAARKERKMALLSSEQLRTWTTRKHAVMEAAMQAKFSQHEALRSVLLATRDAELWHGVGRGQPPERILELETVRRALQG